MTLARTHGSHWPRQAMTTISVLGRIEGLMMAAMIVSGSLSWIGECFLATEIVEGREKQEVRVT